MDQKTLGRGRVRSGKVVSQHSQSPQIKMSRCKGLKSTSAGSSPLFPKNRPPYGGAQTNTDMYSNMAGTGWESLNTTPTKDCNALAVHQVWCEDSSSPMRSARHSLCNCQWLRLKGQTHDSSLIGPICIDWCSPKEL